MATTLDPFSAGLWLRGTCIGTLEFGYSNAEYLDAYDGAILASNPMAWLIDCPANSLK
jgi:hypothetical protein